MRNRIKRIVSGGQTGADRAAFDFALEHSIEIGGYVPKGGTAEDGSIPDKYPNLIETESDKPDERTRLNVLLSDATLIISHGPLTGGSSLTAEIASEVGKPFLHIDLEYTERREALSNVRDWLISHPISSLNIAGPRASEDPHIYPAVADFLEELLRLE